MEKNKFMLLSFMYRYDGYFFNKEITEKRYNKQFLSIKEPAPVPFFHLIRHRIVKKSLGYSYGITDRKTYIETFNWFVKHKTDTIGVISNILYQVFIMYGKLSIEQILALDNFNTYFNKACDHFRIEQRACLLEYFKYKADKEINKAIYYSIFERYREWIPLTKGNIFIGFDLAKAVYISEAAFQLKYVSAQEVQTMINAAGEKTMRLFDSWTSFLASYIIGKYCWLGYDPDEACIRPMNESLYSIYGMITQPSNPLARSGIWQNEDYTELIQHIENMIKFDEPDLPPNVTQTDFSLLISQCPELKGLVSLIRKYTTINRYFNRKNSKRYLQLVGEKDFSDGLLYEKIKNQMEPGEVLLISSHVPPRPVWISNKALYYRQKYTSGEIHKIPFSQLHTMLTISARDYGEMRIYISDCLILELVYEEIKDNPLATHFLRRKAEKEWSQFFRELKDIGDYRT